MPDSRPATYAHIQAVQALLGRVIRDLSRRSEVHDASKLVAPELAVFDAYTPQLAVYGSDEYKAFLAAMRPALAHHYAYNDHHPDHFPDGIAGMNLVQLVELLCDWTASAARDPTGDIRQSLDLNQRRFGYGSELKQVLLNTLPLLEE